MPHSGRRICHYYQRCINLGDLSVPSENISDYSTNAVASSYDLPGSWNTPSVDVSDGSEYRDAFNLYFNYRSPKYKVGPDRRWESAYIKTEFFPSRKVKMQVYTCDDMYGWQLRTSENADEDGFMTVSLGLGRKILFAGTNKTIVSHIAFRILSDGEGKDQYAYYFGVQ